ncbi:hypothetical protein ACUV84_034884 [Puccinellia chinampoensis]
MSKRGILLCVVCVLVVALLAGDHQLVSAAAQIGDEFLCQDPILMLSHAGRDEHHGASVADPALTWEEEDVAVVDEEAFFSPCDDVGDDDAEDVEALLFVGAEHAPDLDRSTNGEELVQEEEDEKNSLLGSPGAVAEGSNGSEEHGSSGGGDVECPECGKHFRSDKSMFGHLRSHPDRGYKGATPPSAKPNLLLPVDNDHPIATYSQLDPSLNVFEILAAYVMLTIKHRDSQIARDQSVKREPDVPGEEDSVMSKAAGDGVALGNKHGSSAAATAGGDMVQRSKHGSSTAEIGGDDHLVHQGSSIVVEAPTKRGRTKKSKEGREAHRKEKGVLSASKARRPYICKHCTAEFPTHQALGGHMAAHNKDRKVQAQTEQAAAAAWEAHHHRQVGGEEEKPRRDGLSASTRELLMERYTRLFNQGRQPKQEETAVGYKRKHPEREDGGAVPVVPVVGDGDRRRLFGIDLNVHAPEQE